MEMKRQHHNENGPDTPIPDAEDRAVESIRCNPDGSVEW